MTDLDFTRRLYRPTDEGFVVKTWLDSYARSQYGRRWGAKNGRVLDSLDTIWNKHRPIVLALIREARIDVVCDTSDANQLYGWACTEPGQVHYAIVKYSVVANGFGKEMLELLFGGRLAEPHALSHEPAWARHVRETRDAHKPSTAAMNDNGQRLPYYYQASESFFTIPTWWKLDENLLARKWCPAA